MNLFDLVKHHLTDEVIGKIASNLGEGAGATQKALVDGVVPAVLAGLVNNFGNSENGAGRLLDLVNAGKHDGGLLADLGTALGGGGQTDAVLNTGKSLMSTVLGSRTEAVTDMLASFGGIRRSSAAALLNLAVPVVLGVIGKQAKSSGLNAAGLLGSLGAAKSMMGGIAPPGLAAALGVADLSAPVMISEPTTSRAPPPAAASASSAPATASEAAPHAIEAPAAEVPAEPAPSKRGSMIPWIIVPVATLLFAWGLKTCQEKNPAPPPAPETAAPPVPAAPAPTAPATTEPSAPEAEPLTQPPADTIASVEPPAPAPVVELTGAPDSAAAQLLAFLRDGNDTTVPRSFVLNELRFAIGTAQIDAASMPALTDIAKVLAAYPTVKIELQGHTDSRGNAERNKTLSQARADAVRNSLLELSVAPESLTAIGFGADKPIDTNDTEEGRAKNRRTELVVVAK